MQFYKETQVEKGHGELVFNIRLTKFWTMFYTGNSELMLRLMICVTV